MIFTNQEDFLKNISFKESLLCLDISKKVFGVAYSDSLQKIAFPCLIIKRTSFSKDVAKILSTYKEKNATGIIVGLPLENSGLANSAVKRVKDTVSDILKYQDIPVFFQDERYSTLAVKNLTNKKNKKDLDDLAATWILQSFLDRKNY